MTDKESKTVPAQAEKTDNSVNTKILLSQHEAAIYLGTSVSVLNVWRHLGKQKIPFVRWGRHIRYRKADLDAWIESNVENKGA